MVSWIPRGRTVDTERQLCIIFSLLYDPHSLWTCPLHVSISPHVHACREASVVLRKLTRPYHRLAQNLPTALRLKYRILRRPGPTFWPSPTSLTFCIHVLTCCTFFWALKGRKLSLPPGLFSNVVFPPVSLALIPSSGYASAWLSLTLPMLATKVISPCYRSWS